MRIPEEAVEAAARAEYGFYVESYTQKNPGETLLRFDGLPAARRKKYMDAARRHVEAIAPYVEAWKSGSSGSRV